MNKKDYKTSSELRLQHRRYNRKHKNKIRIYQKKWEKAHKKERREYRKKYRDEHRAEIQNYRDNHKHKKALYMKGYFKKRKQKDINFKLKCYLRRRLNHALKGTCRSAHTMELVSCSIEHLREHIEKQFKVGMTWANYGKWHVDHIRPCASFDLRKKAEQLKCFNYTNLRPLWALDNLRRPRK